MTFLGKPTSGDSINNSISRDTTEILYQYQGKSFQGQAFARHHDQYFKVCQTWYGREAEEVTWY